MAMSDKMKQASTKAKKEATAEKRRLEKAAHEAGALAEEHIAEVRGLIAKARHHDSPSKP